MDPTQPDTSQRDNIVKEESQKPSEDSGMNNRGLAFWMVFVAGLSCDFLSAFDQTAVSTALPTIVERLNGQDFIWAGTAYALASTAVVPMCGSLVSIFGRKPILLFFIFIFALGSAISGGAQSLNMLIAGRAIQGYGSGGCLSVTEIIYADLVPLPERGKYLGITASVWALASAMGPPIGGAVASSGSWRWLFFLNLPICGTAAILVIIFLRVKAPRYSFSEKISKMDWIGNIIIIGSATSVVLGLSWGGLRFPWVSVQVLLPLFLGLAGIAGFFLVEIYWSKEPTIPWMVVANRTSISGYVGTFFHGIVSLATIYYLPVYFQAVQVASAIGSGVDMFGLAFTVAPSAIICGASVQAMKLYRPHNYIGWMLMIIGFGLLTLLNVDSTRGQYIGLQIVLGVGMGAIWIANQFPILAPLPFSNNAHALAFFTFVRSFAQSWGVAIGGAILQNYLTRHLPASFTSQFPAGASVAYSAIPRIRTLQEPLKTEVRQAFAGATRSLWQILAGISGVGLLSVIPMREIPMRNVLDEQWAMQDKRD